LATSNGRFKPAIQLNKKYSARVINQTPPAGSELAEEKTVDIRIEFSFRAFTRHRRKAPYPKMTKSATNSPTYAFITPGTENYRRSPGRQEIAIRLAPINATTESVSGQAGRSAILAQVVD